MLALIIVGFAMATLGVALLVLGEVPFVGGKRIPARRARLTGLALVSFLPLALGITQLLHVLFGRDTINGLVVTWTIFACCWLAVAGSLFRVLVPKKQRRPAAVALNDGAALESFSEAESHVEA